jgi:hypothetical protein
LFLPARLGRESRIERRFPNSLSAGHPPGHDPDRAETGALAGAVWVQPHPPRSEPMNTHCRLRGKPVESVDDVHPSSPNHLVSCRRCGVYEADDGAWNMFRNMETDPSDRHLLSALTRTAPVRGVGRILIDKDSYVAACEGRIREPTFLGRREALLDWIAFESRRTASRFTAQRYGRSAPGLPRRVLPIAGRRQRELRRRHLFDARGRNAAPRGSLSTLPSVDQRLPALLRHVRHSARQG